MLTTLKSWCIRFWTAKLIILLCFVSTFSMYWKQSLYFSWSLHSQWVSRQEKTRFIRSLYNFLRVLFTRWAAASCLVWVGTHLSSNRHTGVTLMFSKTDLEFEVLWLKRNFLKFSNLIDAHWLTKEAVEIEVGPRYEEEDNDAEQCLTSDVNR